jgi:SAM-dependent methyltransferase
MHWKFKAAIQNLVASLPSSVSCEAYYWIQRHFGGLKRFNPTSCLMAGAEIWKRIERASHDPRDKVFFEVGTGRVPLVPLAFWLLGARKTITVDLNPYLTSELVRESVRYVFANRSEIEGILGAALRDDRLNSLLRFVDNSTFTLEDFLQLCCIQYIAPGDAAHTSLDAQSVDYHVSFNVFEHIPPDVIARILSEGNRIVRTQGLFIHRIDYSDHFSHSDSRISNINFLQYSDPSWNRYAGNRYMYMNRLRHDDFLMIF